MTALVVARGGVRGVSVLHHELRLCGAFFGGKCIKLRALARGPSSGAFSGRFPRTINSGRETARRGDSIQNDSGLPQGPVHLDVPS